MDVYNQVELGSTYPLGLHKSTTEFTYDSRCEISEKEISEYSDKNKSIVLFEN